MPVQGAELCEVQIESHNGDRTITAPLSQVSPHDIVTWPLEDPPSGAHALRMRAQVALPRGALSLAPQQMPNISNRVATVIN